MGTILALQGDKDSGKSTTIGRLYGMLVKSNYSVIMNRRTYKGKPSHDFVVILERNGIKIGITTYGDTPYLILKKLNILIDADCLIIVCACHEAGETVQVLINIDGYSVQFIPKTKDNEADAQEMFNKLEQLTKKDTKS